MGYVSYIIDIYIYIYMARTQTIIIYLHILFYEYHIILYYLLTSKSYYLSAWPINKLHVKIGYIIVNDKTIIPVVQNAFLV